jgi:hypothetical protein
MPLMRPSHCNRARHGAGVELGVEYGRRAHRRSGRATVPVTRTSRVTVTAAASALHMLILVAGSARGASESSWGLGKLPLGLCRALRGARPLSTGVMLPPAQASASHRD